MGKSNQLSFSKLKKTQVRKLLSTIEDVYGCSTKELERYYFYISSNLRVNISNQDLEKLDLPNINHLGLYFGRFHDDEKFRLSIEGSNLIEPTKNYVLITKNETLKSYLSAENLFYDEVDEVNKTNTYPFLVVIYKNEKNLGCISHKEKEMLTYMPKSRKLEFNRVF